ncbi:MAG: flagellar hook-basal body complex protein [Pseudomonadota bacterium]
MDNPGYVTLSRQSALLQDMRVVANNIANLSTTGFRREQAIFTEIVDRLDVDGGSTSQTAAKVRATDFSQGALRQTGGDFDFAIEGDGFFQVETPDGPALTRAGGFVRAANGELATMDGRRVLDEAGGPLFFPPGAREIVVATDGTISADGQPVGRIGVVEVADPASLTRQENGLFVTDEAPTPTADAAVFHGFVETSNVEPVRELTRMIEIQRAYEMGQSFLEQEDERMRQAVRIMGGGT